MEKEIQGICCEAKNCKYHDKNNCCTAGHITVGTKGAVLSLIHISEPTRH